MRNLKRALSLALAFVMVMSMMVVGAGAVSIDDFTDAEEIVNTEAVTTMVSLGVIDGNDDGSYNPTGVVKRGEMAKLIAVMLNGGNEPTLGEMAPTFSDTVGHWAQNYISYVANLHIIDGRGDGSFGPNDDVTGSEAAKMILTALGYRSDVEGFTGANWAINVQLVANDIQLFDGLSINPDEGLSRDDTAQMLYNAVQAQEVEYRNLDNNYDNVIYPTSMGTVLENRFHVVKVEGVVVANDVMDIDGDGTTVSGKVRLSDIYVGGTHRTETRNDQEVLLSEVYPIGLDNSYLGQRVVLYVRGLRDLAPNASTTEVIGTPILSEDNTVVTTTQRFKDANAVRSFLSDNDLSLPTNLIRDQVNGTVKYSADETDRTWNLTRDFPVGDAANTKGTERIFIDHDGDGVVDYIFETKYTMAKVTSYNETDETLTIAGEGSLNFKEVANEEDVAKDDIVLYYKMNDTYYLSVAETVAGEVVSYNDSNKTVALDDGSSYGKSTAELHNASTDLEEFLSSADLEEFIGNTYTFYLDNDGNVVGWVLGDESVGNYAIVLASEGDNTGLLNTGKVKLLLADGTEGIYDVDLLASANRLGGYNQASNSAKESALAGDLEKPAGTAGSLVNRLVTYVIDGSEVILSDPTHVASKTYDSASSAAGANNRSGNKNVSRAEAEFTFDDGTKVTVNDSTIFFISNGTDDATVVVGLSNMPADPIDSASNVNNDNGGLVKSAIYTTTSANQRIARAVWVDGYYGGSTNFVYVKEAYGASRPTGTGEIIYTYKVVFENGESGTLQVRGKVLETGGDIEDGSIYEYVMNGNYAELSATTATINGVVSTWSNGLSIRVKNGDGTGSEVSYGIATDANLWNVEGDSATEEKLTANMDVVLGIRDGVVDVAFVKDTNTEFRAVTNQAPGAIEINGENVAVNGSLSVAYGYDVAVTVSGAARSVTYDVDYENTNADQTGLVDPDGTFSMPSEAVVTITAVGGVAAPSDAPTSVTANAAANLNAELGGPVATVTVTDGVNLGYTWFVTVAGTETQITGNGDGYTIGTDGALSVDAGILVNGTEYSFRCEAVNHAGAADQSAATASNLVTVTPGAFAVDDIVLRLDKASMNTDYTFYADTDKVEPVDNNDPINGASYTLTIPAGTQELLIQNTNWKPGDTYTYNGEPYVVTNGNSLRIPVGSLDDTATMEAGDFVLAAKVESNPTDFDDINAAIEAGAQVTISGNLPAGNVDGTYQGAEFTAADVTLEDATVENSTLINGGATVSGILTVAAGGNLQVSQIDIPSSSTLKVEDGSTLNVSVLNVSAGGTIDWAGLVVTANADIYIDLDHGTINGEALFTPGRDIVAALVAANNAGYFAGPSEEPVP